jgi:hypothetical protein
MAAVIALMATLAAQTAQPTQSSVGNAPPSTAAEPTKARTLGQSTYVDVEGGVGYSTNPRFAFGSDTGSGTGYVSLHAVHTRISERTTTLLSAYAQETAYTRNYGSSQSLSVSAHHDAAVNERLRLFVDGSAGYDRNGQLDTRIITVPNIPVLPGTPNIPPPILLPGNDFLAVTGKHYFLSANAGGRLALNALSSLDFSSGLQRSVFRSAFANTSYWSIPASIGYSRQLSPRADVGGRVAFVYTDYDGPARIWTVTPQLTSSLRLSEQTTFVGAIGLSFASVDDGVMTRHSTGLAASGTLCNQGETSHLCARAAIDQQTATVAGPAKTISVGVDYAQQLDADSSIELSVDGSHYSQPISIVTGQNFSTSSYYRAAAAYTRRFGHRLFGGVNLAARKLDARGPDPEADLNASLFLRYRFGDVQ